MNWKGSVLNIFISIKGGDPMISLNEAKLIAGSGIQGDRYATNKGTYSKIRKKDQQITLIENEALVAIERDYKINLLPIETRRNITTKNVPLNHLVNKTFLVGKCVLRGLRLNIPCKYLEKITKKKIYSPLIHRSGLNCEILKSGKIEVEDLIIPF